MRHTSPCRTSGDANASSGGVYLFGIGSGQDTVLPDWGDSVRVGTGLVIEDMELFRHVNGDLTIGIAGAPDLMRLSAVFEAGESRIREILFDDGGRLTGADLLGLTMAPIDGTGGNDTLIGTNLDETLRGLEGQDRLEGKAGNDLLLGGSGTDTYVVGFGSGRDEIREVDGGGGILRLSGGIPLGALVPRLEGSDLLLRFAGTRDGYEQSVRIRDYALHTSAWTIEDDSGASVAMSGFVEAHDGDSDEALQLEFRWGLVHALDRLAAAEGLERREDGRYVSMPYVGSTVETRIVSRRDVYDISGKGMGGSSTESQSWSGYQPASLSRFWRELDFAETSVNSEAATFGAHPESTVQWTDFADVLRHPGEAQEAAVIGADWQFVNFAGAVHCFALESANSPPGCVYNERAAKRAFSMMNLFFHERFNP